MTATAGTGWPTARGTRGGTVLQFGSTRADLMERALVTGDPLADSVVAAIRADGRTVRAQLDLGIRDGLAAVADPHPAVAALLTATQALPAYADDDLLERGSLPYFSMPAAVHMISLSAGALVRVYEAPAIAQVLTTTGRLIDGAERRIRETGTWLNSAMLPGGLRPGRAGYVATLQVRMLHAHMRRLARERGFDETAYGAPINQVDLARTWMDFTVTMLCAEERMGFGLTTAETASVYRYWWVLAHLLGIEPHLVEGIHSNEQAQRADAVFQAVTGPLVPESAELAAASLDSIADLLLEALNVPWSVGSAALHSLTRRFHPPAVCDELGIRRNPVLGAALTVAIGAVRSRRARLRPDPARWESAQRAEIAAAEQVLAEADVALFQRRKPDGREP